MLARSPKAAEPLYQALAEVLMEEDEGARVAGSHIRRIHLAEDDPGDQADSPQVHPLSSLI